jgi:hypothetical protein
VRETWAPNAGTAGGNIYRADHGLAEAVHTANLKTGEWTHVAERWKPSIHMPRSASRILLEITSVRVERLQDIRSDAALAEGVTIEDQHMSGYCAGEYLPPAICAFRDLWQSINGASSWDSNPWVWAIEFKRIAP